MKPSKVNFCTGESKIIDSQVATTVAMHSPVQNRESREEGMADWSCSKWKQEH